MYDIKQFRISFYATVVLGLLGFLIAAEGSLLTALALAGVAVNAFLVMRNHFSPMSRALSNGVTIAAVVFSGYRVMAGGQTPIIQIGEFLVMLQIIKLYEYRANRDYGQTLVLSALLMVAASISTASLIFGIVLMAYLVAVLYCCALFHLKIESERAKAAQTLPAEKVSPSTLRQDQRDMPRSMRKLTTLTLAACISSAVVVFLFFPRGSAGGLFGQLQLKPTESLQAFTDHVSFQQVAKITQSTQIVANVRVWHNEIPVEGTMPLVLRGVTFDRYARSGGDWQWNHTGSRPLYVDQLRVGQTWEARAATPGDHWRQDIQLLPTGTPALFALPGVRWVTATKMDMRVRFDPVDQTLSTDEMLTRQLEYEVDSANPEGMPDPYRSVPATPRRSRSEIDPRIEEFARRPEVTGGLAAQRAIDADVDDLDEQIARNIERYLRTHFTYTLDLTDSRNLIAGQDPMVVFLYDLHRGHCEYFAGAMTLMCQSLGLKARMVAGFHCDEYNSIGGYYTVRQLHAHAWVEVLTRHGWMTFDPTSSTMAPESGLSSLVGGVEHLFNFLEYKWANAVVAYDGDRRDEVLQTVEGRLMNGTYRSAEAVSRARESWKRLSQWIDSQQFWIVSSKVLEWILGLMIAAVVLIVGWYVAGRWKIRRRAARIGLQGLPTTERRRLAEQLGFYENLMSTLQKHKIVRPPHLTPQEFIQTLTFLPADAYDAMRRLTRIFYRVRFGEIEVQPAQQRRLEAVVARLARQMDGE